MMEFNTAEEWAKYIYENALLDSNKNININPERLNELIDLIPKEFIESSKLLEFIQLNDDLKKIENSSLIEVWDMEGIFTIENSIFSKYLESDDEMLQGGLNRWIGDAVNEFECIEGSVYTLSFCKSIDEVGLAKMELRELNYFFESGKCNSMAIHLERNLFRHNFTEQELYEYYLSLLRGKFDSFIKEDETLIYEKFKNKSINYCFEETNIDSMVDAMKLSFERSEEEKQFYSKSWRLAVRLQALLWIKVYLENLIKTDNFSCFKVNFPNRPKDIEDKGNQGFFILNADTNLPILYRELINHDLINIEGLTEFKKSLQKGDGLIMWKSANSCLAYLLEELSCKNIILTPQFWKRSESIFKIKGKHSALRCSASQIGRKNKALIDGIVNLLTTN